MAMIHCPGCHQEIDNLNLTCPLCGVKTPTSLFMDEQENEDHGRGLRYATIILLLIILAWLTTQLVHNWNIAG